MLAAWLFVESVTFSLPASVVCALSSPSRGLPFWVSVMKLGWVRPHDLALQTSKLALSSFSACDALCTCISAVVI